MGHTKELIISSSDHSYPLLKFICVVQIKNITFLTKHIPTMKNMQLFVNLGNACNMKMINKQKLNKSILNKRRKSILFLNSLIN